MVFRTALGKTVDMSAVVTKNEKVRAVGNMNVNARGDVINNNNEVVNDSTQRVKASYSKMINQNGSAFDLGAPPVAPQQSNLVPDEILEELTPEEREFEMDMDEHDVPEIPKQTIKSNKEVKK
jgi:hypothetical protein